MLTTPYGKTSPSPACTTEYDFRIGRQNDKRMKVITTSLPCHRTQGNAEEERGAAALWRTTLRVPSLSVFAAAAAATGSAAATTTRRADTTVASSANRLARTAEASEFHDHPVGILRVAPNGLHAFAQRDFYLDRCEHEERGDSFNFIHR